MRGLVQLLVLAFASLAAAFNELLPAHGRICYKEHLKPGDEFGISFQVGSRDPAEGDQLVADFWVTAPGGRRVVDLVQVPDAKPTIPLEVSGDYEFCFGNEKSNKATKDVTFHIHHVWASELRDVKYNTLDGQIKLLGRLIQDVGSEQDYLMIRERTHRNTAESTNDRIKWWNILQLLVVVANAVFQVYYLKRFFEIKSNV